MFSSELCWRRNHFSRRTENVSMNHLTLGSRFLSGCGIKLFLGSGQRYWSSNTHWELTVRISFFSEFSCFWLVCRRIKQHNWSQLVSQPRFWESPQLIYLLWELSYDGNHRERAARRERAD